MGFINFVPNDGAIFYIHTLILIVAKCLDNFICEFHNKNKFDFIINRINYHEKFINAYKNIK